jgi:hypothetical protein
MENNGKNEWQSIVDTQDPRVVIALGNILILHEELNDKEKRSHSDFDVYFFIKFNRIISVLQKVVIGFTVSSDLPPETLKKIQSFLQDIDYKIEHLTQYYDSINQ